VTHRRNAGGWRHRIGRRDILAGSAIVMRASSAIRDTVFFGAALFALLSWRRPGRGTGGPSCDADAPRYLMRLAASATRLRSA
jgi:hypothetical protein